MEITFFKFRDVYSQCSHTMFSKIEQKSSGLEHVLCFMIKVFMFEDITQLMLKILQTMGGVLTEFTRLDTKDNTWRENIFLKNYFEGKCPCLHN